MIKPKPEPERPVNRFRRLNEPRQILRIDLL
jgi:hypothetical protein